MADTNQQQQLKEITEKLEQGIQSLFDSESYKAYLKTMSKFHNYSFSNTLLIAMQKPDATLVAGYGAWQSKFKRNVMRGEKSIKIFAPAPYKTEMEKIVVDPDTKRPILDALGEPVKETIIVKKPAFKVTSVFDVSQTDGEPLPEITVEELKGSVEGYELFFQALEKTSKVPIGFEAIHDGANGYYHHVDKRIALREGMSEIQNIKTAIHELAHSRLHDVDVKDILGGKVVDRHTREVQAESVAYTVCQHYGIETSEYSFGYIAGWSNGRELPELKASMETIRSEANSMIQEIDQNLEELRLVQEVEKTQSDDIKMPIMDNTILLASDLSDFAQEADPYEYLDMYDNASDLFNETLKSIDEGNTSDIRDWLTGFIEEDDPLAKRAEILLERVKNADSAREQLEDAMEMDSQEMDSPEADSSEMDCYGRDCSTKSDLKNDTSYITFYAAECMEFPNFGELHEGLTLDEALEIYHSIPKERMNGGKGIGFELHDDSVYDGPFDLMVNGKMQTDIINEIQHYRNSPLVQDAIRELEEKLNVNVNSVEKTQSQVQNKAVEPSQIKEHLQLIVESNEGAFQVGDRYLYVQKATDGSWDYTLFNHKFEELDGGQLGDETMNFEQAVDEIILFNDLSNIERHSISMGTFDEMRQSDELQNASIDPSGLNVADLSGDMDAWRQSHNATCNCAQDFIKGYEMAYHNRSMNEFLKDMVDKYGMDRCFTVLASTIQLSQEDGRYYPSTKKAAMEIEIPGKNDDSLKDIRTQYRVGCHPVTINAAFRELTKMKQEQPKNELVRDSSVTKDERKSRTSVLERLYDKQKEVIGLHLSDHQIKGKNRGEVL